MKVVINRCYGGFGVSTAAVQRLRKLGEPSALKEVLKGEKYPDGQKNTHDFDSWCRDIPRNSPLLLQVLEELGEAAQGSYSKLDVVEVPDDASWEIAEYDGMEHVAEKHRTWG